MFISTDEFIQGHFCLALDKEWVSWSTMMIMQKLSSTVFQPVIIKPN